MPFVTEVIDKWPPVLDAAAMSRNLRTPRTGATPAELAYPGLRFAPNPERENSPLWAFGAIFVLGVLAGFVLCVVMR